MGIQFGALPELISPSDGRGLRGGWSVASDARSEDEGVATAFLGDRAFSEPANLSPIKGRGTVRYYQVRDISAPGVPLKARHLYQAFSVVLTRFIYTLQQVPGGYIVGLSRRVASRVHVGGILETTEGLIATVPPGDVIARNSEND